MPSLSIGQHMLSTSGKAIVNQNGDSILLRGMGLGGYMLQEGYMLQTAGFANAQYEIRDHIEQLIGAADTDLFYEAWLANHVRKIDIDSLKAWGFNSVRLPMHYNLFTLPIEDEPVQGQNTWLTKGFELTDSVISWCKQNQMYVILDLHAAPGGQGQDAAISDYNPNKPSLWESSFNRQKTVALWKKLAERYANEQWVAGYDLLNEPNWPLNGNIMLRNLYWEITDSIRTVDNNHMIIIEGNWWANDFTGLTPPWDNNMVYSPHKYWSFNDEATMQWVIDIRNQYNVPLYLGESGENSNVWFRDAIRLLEDLDIGWAWWPMKKIESVAGPLSINKSAGYQSLLDYWSGTGSAPTAAFAKATLMQLTDDLKLENCRYQKDVIDAMFRQVYSNETVPFRNHPIPGLVISTDYDLGVVGEAYYDNQVANYSVSSGNYTPWNSGWAYRNDGVDIEPCQDNFNTNGYNVGFIDAGEWMKYSVQVAADAVYDIEVRVASAQSGGKFHLEIDGADFTPIINVPNTGGWQSWQTVTINDVVLNTADQKMRFYANGSGFNLNSFKFIQKGATNTLATDFMSASTIDEHTIRLNLNKPISDPQNTLPNNFEIFVDGVSVSINNAIIATDNPRSIIFTVNTEMEFRHEIKISYNGNQIVANDGTTLQMFTMEDVENTLPIIHDVPGRIEAEEYFFQSGTQLEFTSDLSGFYNVGYLDTDDYLDYNIRVGGATTYDTQLRTASESATGEIEFQLIDTLGVVTVLKSITIPPTGGWQSWATTSNTIYLPAGDHHLRLLIKQAPFNINWFEFNNMTNTNNVTTQPTIVVSPNPMANTLYISGELSAPQQVQISVINLLGQTLMTEQLSNTNHLQTTLDVSDLPQAPYFVRIQLADGTVISKKVLKQ